MARCLGSNAVAWLVVPLSLSSVMPLSKENENGKKPLRWVPESAAAGGAAWGAAVDAPALGCGAGVGSGTFSANPGAVANTVAKAAAAIVVALTEPRVTKPRFAEPRCTMSFRSSANPLAILCRRYDRAPALPLLLTRYGEFAAVGCRIAV